MTEHHEEEATPPVGFVLPTDIAEDITDIDRQYPLIGAQNASIHWLYDKFTARMGHRVTDAELIKLKSQVEVQAYVNKEIMESLASLHKKIDDLPKTMHEPCLREFECDFSDALFAGVDRECLHQVEKKVGDLSKEKKEETKRERASDSDVLKLKAASTIIPELDISKEEVEKALKAQKEYEASRSLIEQMDKEEANKVELSDLINAHKSKLGKLEKTKI
ncbi:hypothetical protein L6452_19499 [Arctium lappa]|uniref:Uncharacterized protein n=1 Tax=Arctium lappa TaxID=4217 RepID=A0ACB9B9J0_ARCLA|nr:hypothetical protein L6452_19499 [Arctium lappa]